MTEDRNREDRYVVTDHERIRRLAESEGAEPVSVERGDAPEDVRLRPTPDDPDAERITWDEFFDRFDGADRAVQYRPDESDTRSAAVLEVVDRSTRTAPVSDDDEGSSPHEVGTDPLGSDDAPAADPSGNRHGRDDRDGPSTGDDPTEDPAGAETETLATGDTGDAEPVAFERTEEAADRDDVDEAAVAPASDTERAPTPATEGLVLDEIHGSQAGTGDDVSDEYLVFENVGDRPIDLSGMSVENGHGRSYRFPSETVLEPGTRLTLHSGAGDDEAGHRYWDSPVPVWDDKRIEVVVETETGERVLRETYET